MALELKDLKENVARSHNYGRSCREDAYDDLEFNYLNQWNDETLDNSPISYRGQFDMTRKTIHHVLGEMMANPVQVTFLTLGDENEELAEFVDGMYRTDDTHNSSIEAYEVAKNEMVVCGYGAWRLRTEYASVDPDDHTQEIRRTPIYEANNVLFWDPDAKMMDKSDAKWVAELRYYSFEAYKGLVERLTGESEGIVASNFASPETGPDGFHWYNDKDEVVYVVDYYDRRVKAVGVKVLSDPFGQELTMKDDDLVDILDDLKGNGYKVIEEKKHYQYCVTKYIASGEKILSSDEIVGEHLPIVPCYGERTIIDSVEYYEGIIRTAKDPQRLLNFQLSSVTDIASRSPRKKPIFLKKQIRNYEFMYQDSGVDNNYAYVFQHSKAPSGRDLPLGPVGMLPEQSVPESILQSVAMSRQALQDLTNPGLPKDISDPDLSGKAILALNNRLDTQNFHFPSHFKHAKRRDAEIYVSMAKEVHDVPRKVLLTMPDGRTREVRTMEKVFDRKTGKTKTLYDMSAAEFNVTTKIGLAFTTQKEMAISVLERMLENSGNDGRMRQAISLKLMQMNDGPDLENLKNLARKEAIMAGFRKPETPEEMKMFNDAQQKAQKPSAEDRLAEGKYLEGKAAVMKEERESVGMQADVMIKDEANKIKRYREETNRMNTRIKAKESGANIAIKSVMAAGKAAAEQTKSRMELLRASVNGGSS